MSCAKGRLRAAGMGFVSTLFPLVLPSVIPLLPLPAHLRTPASYRRLLITILSLYLAFSLAASVIPILLKPSFYDVLGVPRLAEPADISAGWKAFARRNHPDRQRGPGSDAESSAEIFRIGRVAYDTLADDEHRWAYDRFGPDSTNWWKFCATRREFLKRGLQDTLSFYVSSVLIYAAMAFFGTGAKETSFWRYFILPVLLVLELSLLLAPAPGASDTSDVYRPPAAIRFLSAAFPGLTQHALVQILRHLSMSATMFLNQVAPLLFTRKAVGFSAADESEADRDRRMVEEARMIAELTALIQTAELEAARVFQAELAPILEPSADLPDPGAVLHREMEDVLIDSRLRSHPAVAPFWQQAVERSRTAREADDMASSESKS